MPDTHTYTIDKKRLSRGCLLGFRQEEDETLTVSDGEGRHVLVLRAVDSGLPNAQWGRIRIQAKNGERMVLYLWAAASDEDLISVGERSISREDFLCDPAVPVSEKTTLLEQMGAQRSVGSTDVLLYPLSGRRLYLLLELAGEGSGRLTSVVIDRQGDNFMHTFPAVYQERGSFFHRFLSVFSSVYHDFDEQIANLPHLLDVSTCPAELLPYYASWMGIDVGTDFLEEEISRPLLSKAYELHRMKGTRSALECVTEIVVGEKPKILERNVMEPYVPKERRAEFNRLYGDSRYDVTILLDRELSERKESQLLFLLRQFAPVRCRLHIVGLKQNAMLDDYIYLDDNAVVSGEDAGMLDEKQALDQGLLLQE